MRLYFEIAGHQIDGARDYQEDAFLSSYLDVGDDPKGSALVIMADGMGGHAAGNIASNLVVSTFNKTCTAMFGTDDVPNTMRVALAKANAALSESIRETPALDGMGCTMVAGLFHEGKVWWVSVGDSHLYVVRDRELNKKNEDHSYGGYLDRMASQGMDVEPEPGLSRNMLMSAMTGDDIAEVDCPNAPVQLLPGDRVIIASDGLDTLSEGTIIQMSAWSSTPKECVDALLKAIEDAGKPRQDNATVIVVDVADRDAEGGAPAVVTGKSAPAMDETQPLSLAEIEEAMSSPRTEMLQPPAPPPAEAVQEEAESGTGSGARIVAVVVLLLVILGAVAGGAYWWLNGPDDTPEPELVTAGGTDGSTAQSTTDTQIGTGTGAGPDQGLEVETLEATDGGGEAQGTDGAATNDAGGAGARVDAGITAGSSAGAATGGATQPGAGTVTTTPKTNANEFRDPLRSGGEGPVLTVIPPGTFEMGSNLFDRPDENPRHGVSFEGFAVGKYEVTHSQYETFARATGRKVPRLAGGDPRTAPVVNVSWDDAVAYTNWLSEETGESYRLLSEAQWEYVASAANSSPYWWGYDFEKRRAHCFDCQSDFDNTQAAAVGSFPANPFGVHDTAGNVLEWVYDCYHATYSGAPDDGSVWEGGDCTRRVARGGAYNTPGDSLRNQKRTAFKSTVGRKYIGFRVARVL